MFQIPHIHQYSEIKCTNVWSTLFDFALSEYKVKYTFFFKLSLLF